MARAIERQPDREFEHFIPLIETSADLRIEDQHVLQKVEE